jgi:hypothetical protein
MESVWFNNFKRWLNDAKQYNNCQRAIFIGDANRLSFSKTVVCSVGSSLPHSLSNLREESLFTHHSHCCVWMDQRRNRQQNAPTAQVFTFYLVIHRNCSDSPSIKMTWRNSAAERNYARLHGRWDQQRGVITIIWPLWDGIALTHIFTYMHAARGARTDYLLLNYFNAQTLACINCTSSLHKYEQTMQKNASRRRCIIK